MIAAGCEAWERAEELAVMGLFEIIPHLPRLLRIRRTLRTRVLAERPDEARHDDVDDRLLDILAQHFFHVAR